MQLGTRWKVGDAPPEKVPATVVERIREVETQLVGFDTSAWRWTLTWLEGHPHVELDDGTVIRFDPATDTAVVEGPA